MEQAQLRFSRCYISNVAHYSAILVLRRNVSAGPVAGAAPKLHREKSGEVVS